MQLSFPIIVAVNGVVLFIVLLGLLLIVNWSITFTRALGDDAIQDPLRWRIIRLVMLLLFIALATAIFNVFFT